jgi:hypothetical protein
VNFGVVVRLVSSERRIAPVNVRGGLRGFGALSGSCGGLRLYLSGLQYESRGLGEFGVLHGDSDLRESHGRAFNGAVEDAIGHALGA